MDGQRKVRYSNRTLVGITCVVAISVVKRFGSILKNIRGLLAVKIPSFTFMAE
jgi:hypothetical protein